MNHRVDQRISDNGFTVLNAALAAFEEVGIRRTTMNEIARRAGVGRATLYRRYPDKTTVIEAVLLREARQFLAMVDRRIDHLTDPAEQTVECFVTVAVGLREHPLLNHLLSNEEAESLPALTIDAAAILAMARGYIADKLRRHQHANRLPAFDPEPAAEIFVRLAHSLLLTPSGCIPDADNERGRAFARAHLVPVITG